MSHAITEVRAPESEMEDVPCVLCGSLAGQVLSRRGQHGFPAHVRICPNDGLVYLSPRWTKSRYDAFYAHEYDRYYRPQELRASKNSRYEAELDAKGKMVLERMYASMPTRTTRLLEIGSGSGNVIKAVASGTGATDLCVVEPSLNARDRLRTLGLNVIGEDMDSDWDAEGPFDAVIMRHVLEHLLDPVRSLRRVRTVLREGGVVYIAVPDMMHPVGELETFFYRCVHTFYYSLPTLTWVAARAGLAPVATGTGYGEFWAVMQHAEETQATGTVFAEQLAAIQGHRPPGRAAGLLRLLRGLPGALLSSLHRTP